ncbi:hypothetical protein JCM19297_1911 [Nonlabens ulvanivorans]|nr:hypothetical protein JCM19297_1911 [Nonlabens ulvanivorans]
MSDDFKNESIDIMLIYANTEDQDLQKDFENETADMLTQKGITSYKMHESFQTLPIRKLEHRKRLMHLLKIAKRKISAKYFLPLKNPSLSTRLPQSLYTIT